MKKFEVGRYAVNTSKPVYNPSIYGEKEKVMKRSACYVWLSYLGDENELEKIKIRKDESGNEYLETDGGTYIYKPL